MCDSVLERLSIVKKKPMIEITKLLILKKGSSEESFKKDILSSVKVSFQCLILLFIGSFF